MKTARRYTHTLTMAATMTAYIIMVALWGPTRLSASIVAATVIIATYGQDVWRNRYQDRR